MFIGLAKAKLEDIFDINFWTKKALQERSNTLCWRAAYFVFVAAHAHPIFSGIVINLKHKKRILKVASITEEDVRSQNRKSKHK